MNVFEKVAIANGVDEKQVMEEIVNAIHCGVSNPEPEVREFWKKLFPSGKEPSPEELIQTLVGAIDC